MELEVFLLFMLTDVIWKYEHFHQYHDEMIEYFRPGTNFCYCFVDLTVFSLTQCK